MAVVLRWLLVEQWERPIAVAYAVVVAVYAVAVAVVAYAVAVAAYAVVAVAYAVAETLLIQLYESHLH